MKHILILAAAVLAVGSMVSCAVTPEQQDKLTKLVDLGVKTGAVDPGTSLLIKEGFVIVSDISNAFAKNQTPPKKVSLEESGLAEAVEKGTLHVGDIVTTHDGVSATVLPAAPTVTPPAASGP